MSKKLLAAAGLVLVAVGGIGGFAGAWLLEDHAPSLSAEKEAIRASALAYIDCCTALDPDRTTVSSIRLSDADASWAAAAISSPDAQGAVALFQRKDEGDWRLVTEGTADVGCSAPAAVRFDLGLSCQQP